MADTNFGWTLTKGGAPVAEIVSFGDFDVRVEPLEKTHHGSPNAKEYISSKLADMETVELTCNATQAVIDQFFADELAGTVATYSISFSGDLDPWGFAAFPTRVAVSSADAQSVDVLEVVIELRPTPPYDFPPDGGGSGS